MDSSGSIKENHFATARTFIGSIVQNFDVGRDRIRVGLVQYGRNSIVEFLLNEYDETKSLQDAIENVE